MRYKKDTKMTNICIFMMLLLSLSLVSAVPLSPEIYYGIVYVENETAQDGSILTLETISGEFLANQTLPVSAGTSGSYNIQVDFDDLYTSEDEGADTGEQLVWKLDDIIVMNPGYAEDTAQPDNTNPDFDIIAVVNPSINISVSYPGETDINESIDAILNINNSASGSANITIGTLNESDIEIDGNISSFILDGGESVQKTLEIIPKSCGNYSLIVPAYSYNLAGALVETYPVSLDIASKGKDISILSIEPSKNNPVTGEMISFAVVVENKGDYSIEGFNLTLYDGNMGNNDIIDSKYTNITLIPGEEANVVMTWKTQGESGEHEVNINAVIDDIECSYTDNSANTTISISSGSSGGGGGGSSSEEENPVSSVIKNEIKHEGRKHYINLTKEGETVYLGKNDEIIFDIFGEEAVIEINDIEDESLEIALGYKDYINTLLIDLPKTKEFDFDEDDEYDVYALFDIEDNGNYYATVGLVYEEALIPGERAGVKMRDSSLTGRVVSELNSFIEGDSSMLLYILVALLTVTIVISTTSIVVTRTRKNLNTNKPMDPLKKSSNKSYLKALTTYPKKPLKKAAMGGFISKIKRKKNIEEDKKKFNPANKEEDKPNPSINKHDVKDIKVNDVKAKDIKVKDIKRSSDEKENKNPAKKEDPNIEPNLIKKEKENKISKVFIGSMKNLTSKIRSENKKFDVLGDPKHSVRTTCLPYEHLAKAIDLVEAVHKDPKPIDELMKIYGKRYPSILIHMAGKHVFNNLEYKKKINVNASLKKLGVLGDYEYISQRKLDKAIEIIAKGYASRKK